MDGFKQILVDDGWNAPFLLKIFVAVDSDIPSVAKHRLKTVPVEFSSLGCPVAFGIEHTANIGYGFSIGIEFKSLLDDMGGIRIDDQFVIFNLVAKRNMTTDIPKGTKVQNYGYYTLVGGVKWLYVKFTYNGVTYIGFASASYLKK